MKLAMPIILIAVVVFAAMNYLVANNSFKTAKQEAVNKTSATAKAYANEMRLEVEHGLDVARVMAHQLLALKKTDRTSREMVQEELREG